ncbi:MAG: DUF362 domain-containing protein [Phycisphaerae bacterium]|nr:DUF362 domain-containing protein [Phycisphaerae bacterium]NIP56001.1 DUF362 domain-containing protein [Phycisphaerae bacterium]NIS54565.1 DUF362 domain-containing protein [Phycisphaerae bacterium]NIU10548.1 DUF362 domain-containing protein [Phycisphaerae bacterium]NIU60009.1 DUF362 domain-containing protein [Phycisphaerae bacterium]
MSIVAKIKFIDYETSVSKALDLIKAAGKLPQKGLVIIKPNLTNSNPPPVTTNVKAVEAVYKYCKSHSKATIAIGEGCGDGITIDTFTANGYTDLAEEYGIRLIDFNEEKAIVLKRKDTLQLKKLYIPEIVKDAFIISLPVLKDHCFTATTVAMKNMFGIAPAPYYRGSWNKSKLHSPSTHKSVVDICLYKKPDLSVVDASVALAGSHLSGESKNFGLILASFDAVAVDAVSSELLGHDPKDIQYLTLANNVLGSLDSIEILHG